MGGSESLIRIPSENDVNHSSISLGAVGSEMNHFYGMKMSLVDRYGKYKLSKLLFINFQTLILQIFHFYVVAIALLIF